MILLMLDYFFVYWVMEYFVYYLVFNGVKVYKYDKGFLYVKIMVFGGYLVLVGLVNLDYCFFWFNFEVNVFIYNEQLVGELKVVFENDLKDCI